MASGLTAERTPALCPRSERGITATTPTCGPAAATSPPTACRPGSGRRSRSPAAGHRRSCLVARRRGVLDAASGPMDPGDADQALPPGWPAARAGPAVTRRPPVQRAPGGNTSTTPSHGALLRCPSCGTSSLAGWLRGDIPIMSANAGRHTDRGCRLPSGRAVPPALAPGPRPRAACASAHRPAPGRVLPRSR